MTAACAPRPGLRTLLARLARGALPQCCALCAAPSGNALLCAACDAALPRIGEACPQCALPSRGAAVCGACLRKPPPFSAAVAVFAYAFPVDRLLQRLKYGGALALADWAALALARALGPRLERGEIARPDVLVPLPLARMRQRERGYNQAQEIARRVARRLNLPLASPLQRVKAGAPQAALPWSGRAANVRQAFACRGDVQARHVALLDDVLTTGATSSEAARTLLRAGAASVAVWVIARTPPPRD